MNKSYVGQVKKEFSVEEIFKSEKMYTKLHVPQTCVNWKSSKKKFALEKIFKVEEE